MKKILCFGDSNVYGFNPVYGTRYDKDARWSGILAELIESEYNVIEAGCNNRTAFSINPAGEDQTGIKVLPKYLEKHSPDIIILAVGINDLQISYKNTIEDIKKGIENLINIMPEKQIILLSPSNINENIKNTFFNQMFDDKSIKMSQEMSEIYKKIAIKHNLKFIDLNTIAPTSNIDGLHYTPEAHKIIAERLKDFL